ncbi:regulatory protein ToxS [Vibrio sp.]|nr:regulatory protein ToxS [Vibrio sp.]
MYNKLAILALAVSAGLSGWMHWGTDVQLSKLLSSSEWQSKTVTTNVVMNAQEDTIPFLQIEQSSNIMYLDSGNYVRQTRLNLITENPEDVNYIDISEEGIWSVTDNYLLLQPNKFESIETINQEKFSEDKIALILQTYKQDSQSSRKIEVINESSILASNLNQGSSVLVAH